MNTRMADTSVDTPAVLPIKTNQWRPERTLSIQHYRGNRNKTCPGLYPARHKRRGGRVPAAILPTVQLPPQHSMPAETGTPPRLRTHLTDASGGLGYHLRAMRYRRTLWQPFITELTRWLEQWRPPSRQLVLIGPSAGYTLPEDFLSRFERVSVLEPDPLARWLLKRRFTRQQLEFGNLDCLASPDGPDWLARRYATACLLFCNVLGQAPAISQHAGWAETLRHALRHHHWASWHDVLSATSPPLPQSNDPTATAEGVGQLASRFWRWPTKVLDHDSLGLVGHQDGFLLWQLTPRQWQLVEWGTHQP